MDFSSEQMSGIMLHKSESYDTSIMCNVDCTQYLPASTGWEKCVVELYFQEQLPLSIEFNCGFTFLNCVLLLKVIPLC